MPCKHTTLLQTAANGTSGHRMLRNRLNRFCYGLGCGCAIHHCHAHNPPAIMGSGATRWMRSDLSVAHVVRLRNNAKYLHISSPPTHDVNFTWFAGFLQGVAFCVASSVYYIYYSRMPFIRINWDRTPFGYAIVRITENRMRSIRYMKPDTKRILKIITYGKCA
ncbi:hypothetical protein TNCV_1875091 [Trichonephila clavipes]|nr:hypothetical protein TNCV_1875091 [Trichonephila clavipes]